MIFLDPPTNIIGPPTNVIGPPTIPAPQARENFFGKMAKSRAVLKGAVLNEKKKILSPKDRFAFGCTAFL